MFDDISTSPECGVAYMTSRVVGGLGNQLFIIAAMFGIKEAVPDVILTIWSADEKNDRPLHWKNFFADCPDIQSLLVPELQKDTAQWKQICEFGTTFTFHNFVSTVRRHVRSGISTKINHNFQNRRYLPTNKQFTLDLFNVKAKQNALKKKLDFESKDTCSLHFRLGDFKAHAKVFTLLTDTYYKKALKIVLERNSNVKKIYVFNELCDQKEVEMRVPKFEIPSTIEVHFVTKVFDLKEDWEQMILISLCESNIMANSTFSWWGAYFNTNAEFPCVVYPHPLTTPWICARDFKGADLFPEKWISQGPS